MKRIMHPQVSSFDREIRDVIDRWREKPLDDRLNVATVVGVLVILAQELGREQLDERGGLMPKGNPGGYGKGKGRKKPRKGK